MGDIGEVLRCRDCGAVWQQTTADGSLRMLNLTAGPCCLNAAGRMESLGFVGPPMAGPAALDEFMLAATERAQRRRTWAKAALAMRQDFVELVPQYDGGTYLSKCRCTAAEQACGACSLRWLLETTDQSHRYVLPITTGAVSPPPGLTDDPSLAASWQTRRDAEHSDEARAFEYKKGVAPVEHVFVLAAPTAKEDDRGE